MHATVSALQALLTGATGQPVQELRSPADVGGQAAIGVWVWRVDEDRLLRPLPAGPAATPSMPALKLSCLILAPDLQTLDAARAAVFEHPVLGDGAQRATVRIDPLDTALLLQLFTAAQAPLRPCLNCVLQATAD